MLALCMYRRDLFVSRALPCLLRVHTVSFQILYWVWRIMFNRPVIRKTTSPFSQENVPLWQR